MPNFIMLVGVPGSGKSTYAKALKEASPESDYQIISRDHYVILSGQSITRREDVTYDESWKIVNHGIVDTLLNNRLQDELASRSNIILDMTNLTKKTRARRLASVSKEYTKSVMYFPLEHGEMMRRAGLRQEHEGKTIPMKVLVEMTQSLEVPTSDEGFTILGTL